MNYNVKFFLEQCLCSLAAACKNIDAEILVVDNNSTDGSHDFFEGRFAGVKFIWNKENVGFSKANNLALMQATGDYILFLNPDTIVPEDCLEKCISFFHQHSKTGAIGVKMIDGAGSFLRESKRGFPSPFTALCKLTGLTKIFPRSRLFSRYYLGHLAEDKDHKVDVLAGAFMMIERSVLDITGGFDEVYFMYAEDIDLSYRIQKAGFHNYYFSGTTIIHFKGESTQKKSLAHIRQFYGAMILFISKYYPSHTAFLYNLTIKFTIGLKGLLMSVMELFSRTKNQQTVTSDRSCFVVASTLEYEKIATALSDRDLMKNVIGRISLKDEIDHVTVGTVAMLPNLIREHNLAEIIFSNSEVSIKDIISIIQTLPPGLHYKFNLKNSCSIVGSSDKDSKGDYISLMENET